jgi:hypothetical protein
MFIGDIFFSLTTAMINTAFTAPLFTLLNTITTIILNFLGITDLATA